jgi:hypothetical protein
MSSLATLRSLRRNLASRAMLVVGMPSALTYLAADLIRDMLARKHGSCFAFAMNSSNYESIDCLTSSSDFYLGVVDAPDECIVRLIESLAIPTIVIDQSLADACIDFASRRNVDVTSALRTMTWVHAGIENIRKFENARVFHLSKDDQARCFATTFIERILERDHASSDIISDRLRENSISSLIEFHFGAQFADFDDEDIEIAKDFENLQKSRQEYSHLPMDLFFEGKPPYGKISVPVDLTGPARCLIYGPYLCLPQGRWLLEASLHIKITHGSNRLGFDIIEKGSLRNEFYFDIAQSGSYDISIPFEVTNSFSPMEFRLHLGSGSIGGELTQIFLKPRKIKADISDEHSPAPDEGQNVLQDLSGRRLAPFRSSVLQEDWPRHP